MALTPPNAGDPISQRDIESMFETVRGTTNSLKEEHISRAAFGPQHFNPGQAYTNGTSGVPDLTTGGIVTDFQRKEWEPEDGGVKVLEIATDTTSSDILANWQHMDKLTLDSSGLSSGWTLEPGWIVFFGNCRLRRWIPRSAGQTDPADEYWTAMAISYTLNNAGSETVIRESVKLLQCQRENSMSYNFPTAGSCANNGEYSQEQTFSWWHAIDTSSLPAPVVLNSIKVYMARVKTVGLGVSWGTPGSATGGCQPEINGGHQTFFSLKSD